MKKIVSALIVVVFFLTGTASAQERRFHVPPGYNLPLAVQDYLRTSPLVIVGKVVAVNPAAFGGKYFSEDNPNWQIATVAVSRTLKGNSTNKTVLIAFPASQDVAFAKCPKFSVGQKAIFILANFELKYPEKVPSGTYYSVFDPQQVQPKSNLKKSSPPFAAEVTKPPPH